MQIHIAKLNVQAKEKRAPPREWTEHFDNKRNRTYYHNKKLNKSVWKLPAANMTLHPYSNTLVMPLADWIETDVAQDLVHEGATLQILGLTNYSHWQSANALRSCFFKDADSHKRLLDIAKQRLRSMLHVGLTENLDHSVASMAAGLGFNLSSNSHRSTNRNYFAYDAPGFDMEQVVTYNASRVVPTGEMTNLAIREARHLLIKLHREVGVLNKKLSTLEPQLQELVEKEDKWLEEEDTKKKKAGQGSTAGSTTGLSVLDGVLERIKKWAAVLPTWPPKAAAAETTRHAEVASDTDLDNDDDNDDNEDESDESTNLGLNTSSSSSSNDEEEDNSVEDNVADDAENEDQNNEKIDSPWAEEIEALDATVYDLQQKRDAIQRDIDELLSNPLIKGPPMPEGPAKLLVPDSEFEDKKTSLGAAYRQCSKSATKKAADKRRSAFKDLVTPWHESFGFSSAERKALDPDILERIRELNPADMEIWELGKQLLEEALGEQAAQKTLQELPAAPLVEDKKNSTSDTADSGGNTGKDGATTTTTAKSTRAIPKPKIIKKQGVKPTVRDEL